MATQQNEVPPMSPLTRPRTSRATLRMALTSKLTLRGGAVDQADVEERKYQQREALFQQYCKEWEYCLGEGGRTLNPIPEVPEEPEGEVQGWNHDGTNPGPEVWQKPSKAARRRGFSIDPWTAPIEQVMEEVMQMVERDQQERDRYNFEGPTLLPEQLPPNQYGDRYVYWDRDEGTRPWPNFRRQLPPGFYQLRMAGSCFILRPDRTFVHTTDVDNHDPHTWGQDAGDRGEWSIDAATYEESSRVWLTFHDAERTRLILKRNQDNELAGQKTFYTGEIPHLDEDLGEVQPNVFEGNLCENEHCPLCRQFEAEEQDELSDGDEGFQHPDQDRWQYAADCLPQQPPLEVPLWNEDA